MKWTSEIWTTLYFAISTVLFSIILVGAIGLTIFEVFFKGGFCK